MKKLSVNGKTFEEIFEERGIEVNVFDMVENETYLISCNDYAIDWISVFDKLKGGQLFRKRSLANSGRPYGHGDINIDEASFVYTATKNQIALLNLYKSQQ